MELTKRDIEKIASLARIELTEAEKEKFVEQIGSVLEYVDQLNEVDTDSAKLDSHLMSSDGFRADAVRPWPEVKPIVDQFPERSGNLNKVKQVL